MIRHFSKPAVILATFLLCGCGVTDTIDSSGASKSNSALILGASRGNFAAGSIRVSPGIHVLEVTCYQSLFARNTHELSVSVEAGATYTLTSQISPNKISDGSAACEAQISRTDRHKN